ncbi:putative quinol monooxygenase [Halocynthiibacter sp. C4]|uniref:putative quinol monooxygenase n=1 Tax=Halocynthiibacter sp. C4 TaxID=2992758 RepID=UPI00237B9E32|nr:putative quinol monooxygenase [Halocynthiibacter sp. C4]MDE0590018.1 putative quinol monooxygenase [Halocynthiibacter sp. C4]
MFVVTVEFTIKPEHLDHFLPAMQQQAATSLRVEPECQQFDVCQSSERPEQIFLYEVYDSAAAFDQHLASDHFKQFDLTVTPWVVQKNVAVFMRLEK